jgi:hypothetical protein
MIFPSVDLPRAVLADDGVHLSGAEIEVDVGENPRGAEALRERP